MRIGSLFSGIGGLELGLERAGVGHTVWQVESDPFARSVLARHWPDATRYDDITTVDWSTVEPVEVLCGGFPCQDISLAGAGAGLAGSRSGLWWEFLRAIRCMGPRYVVVENVAALLVRGMGDVLGALASCGYDAEWDCIPAAAVGAPHRRDRVFVVAYPNSEGREWVEGASAGRDPVLADERSDADRCGAGVAPQPLAHPNSVVGKATVPRDGRPGAMGEPGAVQGAERRRGVDRHFWATEPDVGRVAHGVPARMDRLRCLGNAVVPQVAEVVGRRLLTIEATR